MDNRFPVILPVPLDLCVHVKCEFFGKAGKNTPKTIPLIVTELDSSRLRDLNVAQETIVNSIKDLEEGTEPGSSFPVGATQVCPPASATLKKKKKAKKPNKAQKKKLEEQEQRADLAVKELEKELLGIIEDFNDGEREVMLNQALDGKGIGGLGKGEIIDLMTTEQRDYEKTLKTALDKNGPLWLKTCGIKHVDTIHERLIVEQGQVLDRDPIAIAEEFCAVGFGLGKYFGPNMTKEGMEQAKGNISPLSVSHLDLSKAPTKGAKPFQTSGLESIQLLYLLRRQLLQKLFRYLEAESSDESAEDFICFASSLFTAARKGTVCGRLVVDLRIINRMSRTLQVPACLLSSVHDQLLDESNTCFSEIDAAGAFPTLPLSRSLQRWLAVQSVLGVLVAQTGILGWAPMPAIFQQWLNSYLLPLCTSREGSNRFLKELLEAARLDFDENKEFYLANCDLVDRVRNYLAKE